MDNYAPVYIVVLILEVVYAIFMIKFLNHTKTRCKDLTTEDKHFRSAAVVITWVMLVIDALAILITTVALMRGDKDYGSMSFE